LQFAKDRLAVQLTDAVTSTATYTNTMSGIPLLVLWNTSS
uniref:Carbohydrate kinase n=1 Tax=Haemonchus placei TaxID=6290 RepID=A0A0N4WCD8_HAEPC